jgi:hypothetical protein
MAGTDLFREKSTAVWFAGGWFVLREHYCCLVADKPNEQGAGFATASNCFIKSATTSTPPYFFI